MRQQTAGGGKREICILVAFLILLSTVLQPSLCAEEKSSSAFEPPKLKSETAAVTLSMLGTVIPIGLLLNAMLNADKPDTPLRTALTRAGLIALPFGPSLGLFYAGAVGRGITGIALRLAGMGVMFGATVLSLDSSGSGPALLFGLGGAALVFVSSMADISASGRYVRERNSEIRQKSLDIVPVISPASKTVGIQIRLSF